MDIKSVKNERAAELKLLRAEEAAVNSDVARFCELTDTVRYTASTLHHTAAASRAPRWGCPRLPPSEPRARALLSADPSPELCPNP